jgi:hypothetical protein
MAKAIGHIDTATIRRIAVKADADPRSVEKRIRGERVRGMAGHRVDAVLREHGIEPGQYAQREAA